MRGASDRGYSLVELLVVILIFSVATTLISVSFNRIVASSGPLLKSTETEIGGVIGLELLRIDLALTGFGLPSQLPNGVSYSEAESHSVDDNAETNASSFNDAASSPPRAFATTNNKGFNNSDYLVLKGSALGMTKTARAWSYLNYSSKGIPPGTDLVAGDRVIVVNSVVRGGVQVRELVTDGTSFVMSYDRQERLPKPFLPKNREDRYLVYGLAPKPVDANDMVTFPFNRADYYVGPPSDPSRFSKICAPGTGLLYRGMVTQKGGFSPFPILDCVADMQVMFLLDDGSATDLLVNPDDASPFTAEDIRNRVKEVRVYILAQQGQKELSYNYPEREILVGEQRYRSWGRLWDESQLRETFGPDWMHYRWKLYTIVVQTKNLD